MASKKNDTEQKTLSIFHQVKGRKWKEEEILFLNRCRHTERMDCQIHQALFLEGRREICEFEFLETGDVGPFSLFLVGEPGLGFWSAVRCFGCYISYGGLLLAP